MPNDPVAAVQPARRRARRGGRIRPIGLGRVNGRYFCFHTGIGYDAAVVREVERRASLKRWLGHPLFIYAALRTWLRGLRPQAPALPLTVGERTPRPSTGPNGYFTIVLNTNPYTYLGNRPLDLVPRRHASTRGWSAVTFRRCGRRRILRSLAGRCAAAVWSPTRHLDEHTDVTTRRGRARDAVPVPGRRRLPRRDEPARVRPRARRGAPRAAARSLGRPARCPAAAARPGVDVGPPVRRIGVGPPGARRRRRRG